MITSCLETNNVHLWYSTWLIDGSRPTCSKRQRECNKTDTYMHDLSPLKSTFSPLGYQCDVQSDTPTSAMQTPPFLEFCNSALIIEAVCQRHSLPLCTLQSYARLCATCLMFLERSDCTQKVVTQCFFAYCLSTNICTLHLTPYEVCTPVELLSLGHWFICGGEVLDVAKE